MTIKNKKSSAQPSLFDCVKRAEELTRQSSLPAPARLYIEKEFKAAVTEDLKYAVGPTGEKLSRIQVAERMTELASPDSEITKNILDNWTAPSHPHSMPAWLISAFVVATGGQRRAFEVLSRHSGLFALPGPEALRAEIQQIDEKIKRLQRDKNKRKIYLNDLEGR